MTEKEQLKALLPRHSYALIAKKIGKSYGTVRDYFSPSKVDYHSPATKEAIEKEAKKIVEREIWGRLTVVYGKEKVQQAKAAIAT